MDLQNVIVTEIHKAFTVYSPKGRHEQMVDRTSYGLSFCQEGRITYVQNGTEYVSEVGKAVLLPQGGTYLIRRDQTGSFPVINFTSAKPLCDTITVLDLQGQTQLLNLYQQIRRLLPSGQNRVKIMSIFYEMLHLLSASNLPSDLAPAIRMIDASFQDPNLTNAVLARACNISEVYFRKRFTAQFRLSPKQYVLDVRIQNAKQLLSEGAMKIAAIAEHCGFASAYHFCRIFKRRVGASPSEYRRQHHNL